MNFSGQHYVTKVKSFQKLLDFFFFKEKKVLGRAVDRIPVQNFHKGSDSIMIDFTKKPCVFSP